MQRLNLTVDIDEELIGMDSVLDLLIDAIEMEINCNVIRGKLESPEEIAYAGDWEDEE